MTQTPLDLNAILARVAATSDGPWMTGGDGLVWAPRLGDPVSGSTEPEDAEFIAAARTDVPALIACVQRLTAALADCVFKSAEYGTQDGGFVANYITPTGPIHRAIPLLQELGVTVRPGVDGRPLPDHDPDVMEDAIRDAQDRQYRGGA